MKCGIRYCGGCNPRYERGAACEEIKAACGNLEFSHAVEGETYDCLLVIGGCTNCCAAYDQFDVKGEVFKMWDKEHVEEIKEKLSIL